MTSRLRIGLLYPREMNLYGDRGNLVALRRRAQRRGCQLDVFSVDTTTEDSSGLGDCSGFLIGGGQDLDQVRVAEDLIERKGPGVRAALARGAPLLAVCAGYQLLGTQYLTGDGTVIPGLGLLPLRTEAGDRRLVGNLLVEADPDLGLHPSALVGFENHSGRTFLEPGLRPLGQVVRGGGNDGSSGAEGAWQGNILGTYLHGPLLPKNPALADWWLRLAARASGVELDLSPLDDQVEEAARLEAMAITLHRSRSPGGRLLGRAPRVRRTG